MAHSQHLHAIGSQLSCPAGEQGTDIGNMMHATNIGMTRAAYRALALPAQARVLELGHGNGAHVAELFAHSDLQHYVGLEISALMQQQASAGNTSDTVANHAEFWLYDGDTIPSFALPFDGIFCVNTVYFWREPLVLLQQLHAALRPTGRLSIAYMTPEYMASLPFVDERFARYQPETLVALLQAADFHHPTTTLHHDTVPRKDSGEPIPRSFYVTCAQASADTTQTLNSVL